MEPNKREKDLIKKLINNTAGKAELQEIQQLINTAHGRQLFDEVMDETGGTFEADNNAENTDTAAGKLKQFKQLNNIPQPATVVNINRWRPLLKYAAIVVLMLSAGSYFYLSSGHKAQNSRLAAVTPKLLEYQTKRGQRATVPLADGSVVTLGPASTLKYPESFSGNRRDVYLEGEAFFKVTKNPEKPFVVHAYELDTRVLGTSFKIQAFKQQPYTVSVVTGKVGVSAHKQGKHTQLAVMLPGDRISWYNSKATLDKYDIHEILAWTNNQLIFNGTELSRILAELERSYDVTIDKNELANANEKISVTLDGRSVLSRTMNILAETAGFKYTINGRAIRVFN